MRIPFFKTAITGNENTYIQQVLQNGDSFAEKKFVKLCEEWFEKNHGLRNFYLTKSCTDSLELAALLLGIAPGDEVIMPSYAFVSCGNAFALRGATCVYVDIHACNMTIDEREVEKAITPKTKAIVTINYAGLVCNYDALRRMADEKGIYIIEDNAHGTGAKYADKPLGSFGHISTFSFDNLKNISCGQGGGIAINDEQLLDKFFVHYEFGTNRRSFFKGEADRYEWKNLGSNYPLSEVNGAMLYSQLLDKQLINGRFVELWNLYHQQLGNLEITGRIALPHPEPEDLHNGHCFYIKTKNFEERRQLIDFLHAKGVNAQFHYTPLYNSEFGRKNGRFSGEDKYTTSESQRLLRLPLFYNMANEELQEVVAAVNEFYKS